MQFYGGKKKGKHSSGNNNENTSKPPAKSPDRPVQAPRTPARTPNNQTRTPETPKRQTTQIHSDADTSYGKEPHFASDEYVSREERKASRNWLKRGAIILGVFLLLCVGAYAVFEMWIQPPPVALDGPNTFTEQPTDDGGASTATPEPSIDVVAPDTIGEGRRPGTYTFIIAGLDVEGNHNDTNILGMFDTVEGKLNLVNIPRDTLINIGYNYKKMNQVYPAAINNNKDGVQALSDNVEKLLGYKIDCYAVVDIMAVAEIVDAIGGVYYDIPFDMDWDAPDQIPQVHIHIKAGYQLLDGADFVNAMRFRLSNDGSHNYVGGDIERIAFQQQLLMALAKQTLSLGNIPNIGKIFDVYEQQVQTNVEVKNLGYFAQEFLKLSSEDITFQTIPNKPDGYIYGVSYVIPYIDEWLDMINEYLNPFYEDITERNIDMISWNGDTWRMTQGYLAGGEYSFAGAQA